MVPSFVSGSESLGCFLALITGCKSIGRLLENDFYRITDVSFVSLRSGSLESSSAASEVKAFCDLYQCIYSKKIEIIPSLYLL